MPARVTKDWRFTTRFSDGAKKEVFLAARKESKRRGTKVYPADIVREGTLEYARRLNDLPLNQAA